MGNDVVQRTLNVKLRNLKEILTAKVEPGEANVSYSIEDGDTESC